MKYRLLILVGVVMFLGLASVLGGEVTAQTDPERLYIDLMATHPHYFELRITPIYNAGYYNLTVGSMQWNENIREEGEVGELARRADELLLEFSLSDRTIEGYVWINVNLFRDGSVVARDSLNYWVRNITEEENEYPVVVLSPYVAGSLTVLPNTVQRNVIVALGEAVRLPPTEMTAGVKIGERVLIIHTIPPLKEGIVSLILDDPLAPTAIGYRERTALHTEIQTLRLLEHSVAPRGIYTNYAGPGAYVPVRLHRVWLPLVAKE